MHLQSFVPIVLFRLGVRVDLLVAMFLSFRSQVIVLFVLFVCLFVCLFVIVVYLLLLFSVTRKSLELLKS